MHLLTGGVRNVGFNERPALDICNFGEKPSNYLLKHDFIPANLFSAYSSVINFALDSVRRCFEQAGKLTYLALAWRLLTRQFFMG